MTDTLGFVPLHINDSAESSAETPTLLIDCFSPRAVLDFGDVKAGRTAIKTIIIENPQSEHVLLSTVKFPKTRTVLLHGYNAEESKSRVYRVPQLSCIDVNISWSPDLKSAGGMREMIEIEWEKKHFQIMLIGFIVEVKQKKKIIKKVKRKINKENIDLSLLRDDCTDSQRFKGIAEQTNLEDKLQKGTDRKPVKVLGERQISDGLLINRVKQKGKQPMKTEPEAEQNRPEPRQALTFQPTTPHLPSPFSLLETPTSTVKKVDEVLQSEKPSTPMPNLLDEPPSTPLLNLQEGLFDNITPRKRRTWAAPENPLINAPAVVTRAALKKIEEQQTFMECHSILPADSILDSPPRTRAYERPLPFTPPELSMILPPPATIFEISPDDKSFLNVGPLTATPLHPSMAVKEESLPCFDTSIIQHISLTSPPRNSANFEVPAIETTTSTVNLSQEEPAANPKKEDKGPTSFKRTTTDITQKLSTAKPAAPKKSEQTVAFKTPLIRSASVRCRPKTAPGISSARRDALKKTISQDIPGQRVLQHTKRRSRSEDRNKEPKYITTRATKRKDLVTPNMVVKSPNKRLLQRVIDTDSSFREKRHKSCDVPEKTPSTVIKGVLKRKSVLPPATRVKMQSRLNSVTPGLPRHPLGLTMGKIYFDEKWKMKQQRGFTVWMNFYLCPPEGSLPPEYQTSRDVWKGLARKARKSMVPPDNAKKLVKLHAERKLLQAERRACAIFQSTELVVLKLEKEVNDGGLAVRADRKLDADLGLKDQLIDLLLCYNPIWLRLGLEVLYEEMLPLSHHTDMAGLLTFLNARFVNNPALAQMYAHSTVPGHYGTGYEDELRKFTLTKFLMLVLLLDMAKTTRVLEHDPCLFCLKAPHKSSRAILISFSNTFLSGEGDVTKHLHYIGYTVNHEQKHIDEVDYTVKHIETELRDGTRLTRLVEIITESCLTDKLRIPANSRLQKIHNAGLMLNKLQTEGVKLDNVPGGPIVSKSVVDGNQTLTLALIWRIIFQYSIRRILSLDQLNAEVDILKADLKKQRHLKPSSYDDEDDFVLGLPSRRLSVDERGFFNSPILSALLDWCQTVCGYYDVPVENFTVSFSDGRVLCLLVHHYHPDLIPFSKIQMNTSLAHQRMELNTSRDYLSNSGTDPELYRENEKENFKLLAESMKGLSEVPAMIFSNDLIGTIPDEKVVITFVAYLCAGLVDISQEFRAALRIQKCWRRYLFLCQVDVMHEKRRQIIKLQALARAMLGRRNLEQLKLNREAIVAARRDYAARKIQHNWRTLKVVKQQRCEFLVKRTSAIRIQRFYKAILEERWKDRICAAKVIQKRWRGHVTRQEYLSTRSAVIKMQAIVRMSRCRREFQRTKQAALTISRFWRSHKLTLRTRHEYLSQRTAAVQIQHAYRRYQDMKSERLHFLAKRSACVLIQSIWRMYLVQRSISRQISAAIKIQSTWRMSIPRSSYLLLRTSTTKIQRAWRDHQIRLVTKENKTRVLRTILMLQSYHRGMKLRAEIISQHRQATKIQSTYRGYRTRRKLHHQHTSAQTIQQCYRGYQEMKRARSGFLTARHSAVMIQAHFRGYLVRRDMAHQTRSAVKIQAALRGHYQRQAYLAQRLAACRIQSHVRAWLLGTRVRSEYVSLRETAVLLQSLYRGVRLRHQLQLQAFSATKIQATWRMHKERTSYHLKIEAATKIQSIWRMHKERTSYHLKIEAATKIQSMWRMYTQQQSYTLMKRSAVKIQSTWNMFKQRQSYLHKLYAATKIQSIWRMHRERTSYHLKIISATKIQSMWRMYTQQQKYARLTSAALCIQASYKMYRCRLSFVAQKSSAVTIQRYWRGYVARRQYIRTRNHVIALQSLLRGYKQRQMYRVLSTCHQVKESLLQDKCSLSQIQQVLYYSRLMRDALHLG